jgi:hypothetical protein
LLHLRLDRRREKVKPQNKPTSRLSQDMTWKRNDDRKEKRNKGGARFVRQAKFRGFLGEHIHFERGVHFKRPALSAFFFVQRGCTNEKFKMKSILWDLMLLTENLTNLKVTKNVISTQSANMSRLQSTNKQIR